MKNNIFGFQQESDEDEEEQKQAMNAKNSKFNYNLTKMNEKSKQKVAEEMSKYIFEDPSIYTYDDHYDQIQNQRKKYEEKVLKINRPNQPKHINAIREATERRQREVSIVLERMNEKKLRQEGETFKEKEAFITSSYVEMQEKNKKYQEEQRKNEEYDLTHTVEGGKKIDDFWRNMQEFNRPDLNQIINDEKKQDLKIQSNELNEPQKIAANQENKIEISFSEKKIENQPKVENKAKSRSRSHSKEKQKEEEKKSEQQSSQQEQESQKEQEKQLTKEEKLELARQRYLERQKQKQS